MKIGIISDTHDHMDNIKAFVKVFKEKNIELILHAGDICSPFVLEALRGCNCQMRVSFGNNDGDRPLLIKWGRDFARFFARPHSFELEGKNIVLMHEPDFLDEVISSGKYDLIVYGHTHSPDTRVEGNTRIINPGEACGWLRGKATAVCYDLSNDDVQWINL